MSPKAPTAPRQLSAAALEKLGFALDRAGRLVLTFGGVVDQFGPRAALTLAVKQSTRNAVRAGSSVVLSWEARYPTPAAQPTVAAVFGEATSAEDEHVIAILREQGWGNPERELRERRANGHRCFAARLDGRIALLSWVSRSPHNIEELWDMRLGSDEARLYNSFALPASRGKRLLPANISHLLGVLVGEGVRALHTSIGGDNISSLKACAICFSLRREYRFVMTRQMRRPLVLGLGSSQRPRLEPIDRPFEGINVTNLAFLKPSATSRQSR